jgi:hypothetical protein
MKKALLNSLMAVAVVSGLAACGVGGVGVENDSAATAQQDRDAKALNERFGPIVGTYEGTFSNPDSGVTPHKSRLLLYVVNVREGANPDGTVRVRPALYGRFQLTDVVGQTDYLAMQGDYDSLGNISMGSIAASGGTTGGGGGTSSGAGSSTGGDTATISIKGTILNGNVTIDVSNTGGYWGRFVGSRTTETASAPSASDAVELRERLLGLYRTLEGVYSTTVDTGSQRAPISLTISIAEGASGGSGVSIPYLVAQYRRLDFPAGIGERQLGVNYDALSGRISMSAVSGGSTTVPGSQYFSASGTWVNGNLDVTLRDRNGFAGELKATRKPYRD